MDTCSRD